MSAFADEYIAAVAAGKMTFKHKIVTAIYGVIWLVFYLARAIIRLIGFLLYNATTILYYLIAVVVSLALLGSFFHAFFLKGFLGL